jgi:hypothetical protein
MNVSHVFGTVQDKLRKQAIAATWRSQYRAERFNGNRNRVRE